MLGVGLMDKRPPFVRFETREYGIDAEASKTEGRQVPRMVDFALITPFASKDCVEKPALEWFEQINKQAREGNYAAEWVSMFKLQYDEWKKGNEMPRHGTPVKTWMLIDRERRERLHFLGITTVEDLAEVPDSGLAAIGLDGRNLRDTARGWINEYRDKGINAKAIADAQQLIREQAQVIERLNTRVQQLEQESPRRGPGRPRKDEAEAA